MDRYQRIATWIAYSAIAMLLLWLAFDVLNHHASHILTDDELRQLDGKKP